MGALTSASILAQTTNTWLGGTSDDWHTASNWSAAVPTALIDAFIDQVPSPNFRPVLSSAGICASLTIQPGGQLTINPGAELSAATCVTNGGNVLGGGSIRLGGGMTGCIVSTSSTSILPNVIIGNGSAPGTSVSASGGFMLQLSGSLTITAGSSLHLGAGGASVGGNLTVNAGGSLNLGSSTTTVTGFTTVLGAVANPGMLISLGGSLLHARSTVTFATDSSVSLGGGFKSDGSLNVGTANASVQGALDADGAVTIASGAALALGPTEHHFFSGLTAQGPVTGPGATLEFDGPGTVTTAANATLPPLEIAGALSTASTFTVNGDLTQTAGGTLLQSGGTVTVLGSGSFQSGAYASSGTSTLDINGDVTFSSTSVTIMDRVHCGGNWSADAGFDPDSNSRVVLDKSGTQTVSGAGRFDNLEVAAASITIANTPLDLNRTLTVGGALNLPAGGTVIDQDLEVTGSLIGAPNTNLSVLGSFTVSSFPTPINRIPGNLTVSSMGQSSMLTVNGGLRVDGALEAWGLVTIGGGGLLDLTGNGPHVFHAGINLASLAETPGMLAAPSTATFRFAGGGTNTLPANTTLDFPHVVVDASLFTWLFFEGPDTVLNVQSLSVLSGSLRPRGTIETHVLGPADFSGGEVDFNSEATEFTFHGQVAWNGTSCTSLGGLTVLADWVVNAPGFAPTNTGTGGGFITFAGTTQSIVNDAVLRNATVASTSTVTATGNIDVHQDLTVQPGGTLQVQGPLLMARNWTHVHGTITAAGQIDVQSLAISGSGVLRTDGPGTHRVHRDLGVVGHLDLDPASTLFLDSGSGTAIHVSSGSPTVFPHVTIDKSGNTVEVGLGFGSGIPLSLPPGQTWGAVRIGGELRLVTGRLDLTPISPSAPLVIFVEGQALFQSGVFVGQPSAGINSLISYQGVILECQGGASFSPDVSCGSLGFVRCAGAWTAPASFQPNTGLLELHDGSLNGAGRIPALFIPAGFTATGDSVAVRNDVRVDGSLHLTGGLGGSPGTSPNVVINGALDVGGALEARDLRIQDGGTLTLASAVHVIHGGDFTVSALGQIVAPAAATLQFDGSQASVTPIISVAGTVPPRVLPGVEINAPGRTVELSNQTAVPGDFRIAGSLTVAAGTLRFPGLNPGTASRTITIDGSILGSGGTLFCGTAFAGVINWTLDVAGSVVFSGTACTFPPHLRCASSWTADAGFAPVAGSLSRVDLDGAAATSLGSGAPSGTLNFATLRILNGVRTTANSFTLDAPSVIIEAGGVLAVEAGMRLDVHRQVGPPCILGVAGRLTVAPGADLALGQQVAATVQSGGVFRLAGTAADPAQLLGSAGGGYAFTIDDSARLEARNFAVKGAGAAGFQVRAGTDIAAAPEDLRGGVFDFDVNSPAGAVLLDLRRSVPTEFRYLKFENTPGVTGAANVTTVCSSAAVSFTNWSGGLGGEGFEREPTSCAPAGPRIHWNAPQLTTLAPGSFVLVPGHYHVRCDFIVATEHDTTGYVLERGIASGGPYSLVAAGPAGVGPQSLTDLSAPAGQISFYRLSALLTHAALVLGEQSATATALPPPGNLIEVVPGGSIQAAIDGASMAGIMIRVAPGNYASFLIGPTVPSGLRIAGNGQGPVIIDTSSGPVRISGVAPGMLPGGFELSDLVIGSQGTLNPALVVEDTTVPVLLDELTLASGLGHPALRVTASTKVAAQRSAIAGDPGVRVENVSYLSLARCTVDEVEVVGSSTAHSSGSVIGSTMAIPPGSMTTFFGTMPDLLLPEFAAFGVLQALVFDAAPLSEWHVGYSAGIGFEIFPSVPMPALLNFSAFAFAGPFYTGPPGPGGTGQTVIPFIFQGDALFNGAVLAFQGIVIDSGTGLLRLSTASTMMITVP